jgi:hypothetical protein
MTCNPWKCCPSFGSSPVRRREAARPFVEGLEQRCLLAGQAFGIIEGVLPASGASASVTIDVSTHDFTLDRSGRVALEFVATADSGAPLTIGAPVGAVHRTVGPESAAGKGWRIASLSRGQFTFSIGGAAPGTSYVVDVSLVGDANDSGQVNRNDIRAIRSRLGVTSMGKRYLPGADVLNRGRINSADLSFALSDLGAGTSLVPLSISLGTVQSTSTDPMADVVAQSQPDSSVSLTERGVTLQTVTTASLGNAVLAAPLLTGQNNFQVVATDSFGQRVITQTTVTRAPLSSYLGAAFQPYVGQWTGSAPNASTPFFNSYGTGNSSVANQIALVAPQFPSLSTYSAGYAGYYTPQTPYNQVDSNWMVAGAAAAYNQSKNALKVTVSQGIFQQLVPNTTNFNMPLMNAEVNGAFSIAKAAHGVYAGTVTRLIFTNEFVHDATTTQEVDNLITQAQGGNPSYKDQAHSLGLEVGVRSETFGQLTNPNSPYLAQLQQLVKDVDFIMLNLYPSNEATLTPQQGAAEVESQYNSIKAAARALNPNIDVIISETGWPSQGVSFNDIINGQQSSQDNTVAITGIFPGDPDMGQPESGRDRLV